jgi:hypothetical protein
MKKTTMSRISFLASFMMVCGLTVFLSSCKDDNETTKPAPTITLSATTASNTAGSSVSADVTIDAPEGGKALTVNVNGAADAAFTGGTLDGTESQTITYNYTIPAGAAVGTVYTINFQATDKKDQQSQVATLVVTVSAVPAKQIVEVGTNGKSFYITQNTSWTADKIYRIHGFVRVGADSLPAANSAPGKQTTGVTLTIAPGTIVYGANGSPGGTLVVQRGNQINATGTASAPIIFTSDKAPGSKKAGDWGGIVLCGNAANNIQGTAALGGASGIGELEGSYRGYHGGGANPNNADNSGTLKYVRIEFAGYPINPNQEINGLTMGSVGSGTTLSYIQTTYSNDDSYEWFGGTAVCDHLIAYKGLDDDFDTDNGFSGRVQFGLGIRDQNIADQSGSNGFESDNDANGSLNTPITSAVFSNMTIIGGKAAFNSALNLQFQNVAQIRRNSHLNIINSFFTAYPNGIFIDANLVSGGPGSTGIIDAATNGTLALKNNVLAGVDKWGGNGFGSAATADEQAVMNVPAGSNHPNNPRGLAVAGGPGTFANGVFSAGNTGSAQYVEQQINGKSPIKWFVDNNINVVKAAWTDSSIKLDASIFEPLNGAPTLLPGSGSILLTGGSVSGYTGFADVNYKGAFSTQDWTTGWVNWNPQLTDYSK